MFLQQRQNHRSSPAIIKPKASTIPHLRSANSHGNRNQPATVTRRKVSIRMWGEGMGGFPDPEAVGGELGFHFLQKEVVRNREPRFRTGRGFHTGQGSPVDDFGPAMEEKPFTAYGRRNYRSSCRFRHDISPLEEGCLSGIFQRQDIPGCRRTMRQCDDRMHINDECELKRKHPLPCEWETGVEE